MSSWVNGAGGSRTEGDVCLVYEYEL